MPGLRPAGFGFTAMLAGAVPETGERAIHGSAATALNEMLASLDTVRVAGVAEAGSVP